MEKIKQAKIMMNELPERIINTNENEEVVKTLRLEMKRI